MDNADRSAWVQMNCTVLTWIYGTINNQLQQSVMLRNPNARVAWTFLENEFLGQTESRALLLSAEFHTAKQGSLSITDFCRRLETMAATLGEFGDPISDRTLVLTLLRGLNGKFRHMVSNLKMQRPFPTFEDARTLLLLEEIDIDDVAADATPPAPPAFVATPAAAPRPTPHTGGSSNTNTGQGGQSSQRSSRRRGRGGKHPLVPGNNSGGPRPPASFTNPWAGTVQFWPHPYAPGGGALRMPHRPPPAAFTAIHDSAIYLHYTTIITPRPWHSARVWLRGCPTTTLYCIAAAAATLLDSGARRVL